MSTMSELDEFNNRVSAGDDRAQSNGRSITEPEEIVLTARKREKGILVDAKMWAVYGDRYSPCEHVERVLPPGQYTVENSQDIGIHFHQVTSNMDDLLELPDSASQEVITEVTSFWQKEQHFRDFGFLWKRGMMLWGPPGSGKTVTVQLISQFVIKNNGIALFVNDPHLCTKGLRLLRAVEPNRHIVMILEDVDSIIDNYGETALLALMDGELQIDNVLFIATTNYPERLDKRFINRPSRFDVIKKIGMPSPSARRLYLATKNGRLKDTNELEQWVDATEGFSVAHLKELIVAVEVFGVSFDHAASRLKKMMDVKVSSTQCDDSKFGFMSS